MEFIMGLLLLFFIIHWLVNHCCVDQKAPEKKTRVSCENEDIDITNLS
jgi:hypothetical protein